MLIPIAKCYKKCSFAVLQNNNFCTFLALDSTQPTNNNTPSLPLYNAHLEGFFI